MAIRRLTPKGYVRGSFAGRQRMEHDYVWEQANGPIPRGGQIHHRNGDKADNELANLQLVDSVTHKRLHSGSKLIDGQWWKRCGVCEVFRPITLEWWYISPEGWPLYGRCRACHIRKVVEAKRLRKMRKGGVQSA